MLDLSCLVNQLKEEHACVDINGPPPVGESDDEFSHELPDGSIIHVRSSNTPVFVVSFCVGHRHEFATVHRCVCCVDSVLGLRWQWRVALCTRSGGNS